MNLSPDPELRILDGVPYLMPARELAVGVADRPSRRHSHPGPAFPDRSLKVHPISKSVQAPFPGAALLTDVNDAVVGLQLLDGRPADRPALPAALLSDRWRVYDFLHNRVRENYRFRIAHRVRAVERVVRIDSELVEVDADKPDGLGRSLSRTRLYLPQPIVDLMLMRLHAARPAPGG